MRPESEIVGGTVLRIPAIQSPNFITGVSGWIIKQDGTAEFDNLTIRGTFQGTNFILNTQGMFFYTPSEGAGNLVASIAASAGTDQFGNNYDAGFSIGFTTQGKIELNPFANQQFNITAVVAGIFTAMAQYFTPDVNELVPSYLGSLLLGTGTATKMASILSSPFGAQGAALILQAQNDGATDTPIITMGIVTQPSGEAIVMTPLAAFTPFATLFYSSSGGQTVVTKTVAGAYSIPIPAGVTTALGECWGSGGGGGILAAFGGGGGGGGEYAAEPNLAVTPNGTVTGTIGAAGTGGVQGGSPSTSGSSTTMIGSAATITAHGGVKGTTANGGAGGTGYLGTTHHDGGAGGTVPAGFLSGDGGGSSAGTAANGNNGGNGTGGVHGTGGPGGAAPAGGGAGGAGGGNNGNGANAQAPGGGGGGGGAAGNGGNGAVGKARLTYSTGLPGIQMSIAQAAGTDQFGISYGPGVTINSTLTLTPQAGTPPTPSSGQKLYTASNGRLALIGPSGQVQVPSTAIQSQNGTHTVTQAAQTALTDNLTIKAGEPINGAVYEIVAWGNGTLGSTVQLLVAQLAIGGAGLASAQGPAAGAWNGVASATFRWKMNASILFRSVGAAGTFVFSLDGVFSVTAGPNLIPGNTTDFTIPFVQGDSSTDNINTTADMLWTITCAWGSTTGASTISCIGAYLKRVL